MVVFARVMIESELLSLRVNSGPNRVPGPEILIQSPSLIQDGKGAMGRHKANKMDIARSDGDPFAMVDIKGSWQQHRLKLWSDLVGDLSIKVRQRAAMSAVTFEQGQFCLDVVYVAKLGTMPEVGIPEIIEAFNDAIGSRCVRWDENDFHSGP